MRSKDRGLVDWIRRFVMHVATGALSVLVHYTLMALLLNSDVTPIVASSTGFCAGALTRFLTAYYNVFTPTGTVKAAVPKFLAALAGQAILNSLLLGTLMSTGMGVWWAQVSTTIFMTFLNYLVYRIWVFR